MSDIGLFWDRLEGGADFRVTANDLETDDSFETSVYLSLFTNAPVRPGDQIPPELIGIRMGWWADKLAVVPGDVFGSRLWQLQRVKQTEVVITRAREMALEALQWMLDDKVSDKIVVTAEVLRDGILLLTVEIFRPRRDPAAFKYDYNWQTQAVRRAA